MKQSVDFNDSHVANGLEQTKAAIVGQAADFFEKPKQPYIHWKDDPKEIKSMLPPVQPLHGDMLPEPLRAWLLDISFRMQAPLDFSAAAMMIVYGSVIGAGCKIRPKAVDSWGVVPNLFGMAIGDPSMLKTPSQAEVIKLLDALQFKYRDIFESQKTDVEFDAMMIEGRLKQLQSTIKQLTSADRLDNDAVELAKDEYKELTDSSNTPERRTFKQNETSIQALTVIC